MITLGQYMGGTQSYLDSLKNEIKSTTHVSLPAIVTAFDSEKQTINCIPTIKELVYFNGSVGFKQFPELQQVPIEIPRAGNFAITLPITVGQECRVTFQDLCLDGWWSRGGIQSWNDLRRHDLSDAIATFSPWSQPNVIPGYSTSNLEIRSIDGTTKASFSDSGITISKGENSSIDINSSEIRLQMGSNLVIINSSGIELTTPNLTINGKPYLAHTHSGVMSGPSITGPVSE